MSSQVLEVVVRGKNETQQAFASLNQETKAFQANLAAVAEIGKRAWAEYEKAVQGATDPAEKFTALQRVMAQEAGRLEQAMRSAGAGTADWSDKQQRAAMAMSATHDQALKMNRALADGKHGGEDFGGEMLKMIGLGAALGGGMQLAVQGLELLKEATIGSIEEFVQ